MAHVTLQDGRELDVPDSDVEALDYYRGEGATVEQETADVPPSLPSVFNGEEYVPAPSFAVPDGEVEADEPAEVEQAPDGDFAEAVGPIVSPGTDESMVGFTVPRNSDGTFASATVGPDGATAEVDGETVELQPDAPVEGDPGPDEQH